MHCWFHRRALHLKPSTRLVVRIKLQSYDCYLEVGIDIPAGVVRLMK